MLRSLILVLLAATLAIAAPVQELPTKDVALALAYVSNNELAIADGGKVIHLRLSDTKVVQRRTAEGHILGLAIGPNGSLVAAGKEDRMVRDYRGFKVLGFESALPIKGGKRIQLARDTISAWDTKGKRERYAEEGRGYTFAAWSDSLNGTILAGCDGSVARMPQGSNSPFRITPGNKESLGRVHAALLPDGKRLVMARVWDSPVAASLFELTAKRETTKVYAVRLADPDKGGSYPDFYRPTYGTSVTALAVSPDGKAVAICCSPDARVEIYPIDVKTVATTMPLPAVATCTTYLPDGRLITGHTDGTVRCWSLDNLAQSHTIGQHTGHVTALAVSPDATQLASAGTDRMVRLWPLPAR